MRYYISTRTTPPTRNMRSMSSGKSGAAILICLYSTLTLVSCTRIGMPYHRSTSSSSTFAFLHVTRTSSERSNNSQNSLVPLPPSGSIIRLYGKRGNAGKAKDKSPPRAARISKSNLPEKICVVCNRPFTWRKKWERCWDEVTCCSKSCNAKRRGNAKASSNDAISYDDD